MTHSPLKKETRKKTGLVRSVRRHMDTSSSSVDQPTQSWPQAPSRVPSLSGRHNAWRTHTHTHTYAVASRFEVAKEPHRNQTDRCSEWIFRSLFCRRERRTSRQRQEAATPSTQVASAIYRCAGGHNDKRERDVRALFFDSFECRRRPKRPSLKQRQPVQALLSTRSCRPTASHSLSLS